MGYTGRDVLAFFRWIDMDVDPDLDDCWVSHWNDNPEPFVWTKPADEILDKVARGQAPHQSDDRGQHD